MDKFKIDFQHDNFIVSAPYEYLGICRAIPMRKFHKPTKSWWCPPMKANAQFFNGLKANFTPAARAKLDDVLNGNKQIKRGVRPTEFKYKTEPYPHQDDALSRCTDNPDFALFMDPGTGKSKVLIDDASIHFIKGQIDGCLIFCPNSIKTNWKDELDIHSPVPFDFMAYDSTKKKAFVEWMLTKPKAGTLKYAIFPIETLSAGDGWKYAEKFMLLYRTTMDIDESSRIKNPDKTRTKTAIKLGLVAKMRRVATGTAVTKGIQNLWSQYTFLNPSIIGGMGYYSFRNRYCIMGGYKDKQIMGSMNEQELIEMAAPNTIRISKKDHLNLPPKVYQVRRVKPTAEQVKLDKAIKNSKIYQDDRGVISFDNALTRDLRRQEITTGVVTYIDEDDPTKTWKERIENPKLKELEDLIDEIDGKIIVWCRFQHEVEDVYEVLSKHAKTVTFYGKNSEDDNYEARTSFQKDPDVRFFVGTKSFGGIGITITAAPTTVYMSNTFSLEDRIQSEDRNHRISQEADSVLYIDLIMEGEFVDSRVMRALRSGRDYAEWIMDEFKNHTFN